MMSDSGELIALARRVIMENPKAVEEFRAGKDKAIQSLVGAAMKISRGSAHPQKLLELLKSELATQK